jgi:phosphoribosylamine--glycine ligase
MAVGGWYGPGGWSKWFVENWENKKLMDGDLGVATGEMGTLVRMVKKSKLADKVLLPIGPLLKQLDYVGYVDNNTIIDSSGDPWPLEWTMRDGWPLRHNLTALIKNEDPAQWMLDLIMGKDTIDAVDGEVCVSIVMACPDFPYSKITNKEVCGIPIYGAIDKHIHLSEVMLGNAPVMIGDKVVTMQTYVSAGDYWLIATGCGETITGARKSAYTAIRKIHAPNSPFYRLDIGRGRMLEQLPEIQKHGYAVGLSF